MSGTGSSVLVFSGAGSYATLGLAADLGLTLGSFTVEAWVRIDHEDADLTILGTDETVEHCGLHLNIRWGVPYMGFYRNDVSGRTHLTPGVWYHLAFVYALGTGTQAIFVNGVIDAWRDGAPPFEGTGTVHLGRFAGAVHFCGAIRDLRIWSVARGQPQIIENLWQRLTGREPGLVAFFPLDEGSGESLTDHREALHTGILHQASWGVDPTNALGPTMDEGLPPPQQPGLHARFWETGWIEVPDAPELHLDLDLTLEVTLRLQDLGGIQSLVHKAWGAEGSLRVEHGTVVFRYGTKDGNRGEEGRDVQVVSGGSLEPMQLHTVRVVRRLSRDPQVSLWIDGTRVVAASALFPRAGISPLPLCFGGEPGGTNGLKGHLLRVRVWRMARAPDDPDPSGLVAEWRMNRGQADQVPPMARAPRTYPTTGLSWAESGAPILRDSSVKDEASLVGRFEGPDLVVFPQALELEPACFTIEAWVLPERSTGGVVWQSPVVSKHGPSSGWELRADEQMAAFFVTLRTGYHEVVFTHALARRWFHLAGVYDGKRVQLLVNGVVVADRAATDPPQWFPGPLMLTRNPVWQDRGYQGLLAEVRFWSVPRAPSEIQRDLFRRCTGSEKGLIALWGLETLEGDRVLSRTGRFDGISQGMELISSLLPPGPVRGLPGSRAGAIEAEDVPTLRRDRDELRRVSAQMREVLDAQNRELERLRQTITQLEQALTASQTKMAEQAAVLHEREAALQRLEEERDSLHRTLVASGAQVSLEDLIKRSNDEVQRARAALETRGGAYRLGKVSLELKMVPGSGGVGLSFPSLEQMTQLETGALSTLQLDLSPREQESATIGASRKVPDVVGATESLARRKLTGAGLVVEVNFQAVVGKEGDLSLVDRVVTQLPMAGQEVIPGATVVLFIGKQA